MYLDKVAWYIFLAFVGVMVLTALITVLNIFPYYLHMSQVANNLLMSASVNNYVQRPEVDELMKKNFEEGFWGNMTYQDGVEEGIDGDFDAGWEVRNITTNNSIVIDDVINPQGNFSEYYDDLEGIGKPQRGHIIKVSLVSEVTGWISAFGYYTEFGIPLGVERYGVCTWRYPYDDPAY